MSPRDVCDAQLQELAHRASQVVIDHATHAPPFVTIAIPCRNEVEHLQRCWQSVRAQDYPMDRLEIIVADGMSTDGTRDHLRTFAEEDQRIHIIDNPDRIQAAGLNRILRVARGLVIVRMDVRCVYEADYVLQCIDVLSRTGADNVGGAQRLRATTGFQRAVCAALSSPLGTGGARHRQSGYEGTVDTIFLGAFRRSVFERVGLYDEGAITNEDAELNQRIVEAGGNLYQSRAIVTYYYPRGTLVGVMQQYLRYGRGRARTLLKHRRLLVGRSIVPFLGVAIVLAMVWSNSLRVWTPALLAPYLVAVAMEAVRMGHSEGLRSIATLSILFPILHISHGVGFAIGLIQYLWKRDWTRGELLGQTLPKIIEPLPVSVQSTHERGAR